MLDLTTVAASAILSLGAGEKGIAHDEADGEGSGGEEDDDFDANIKWENEVCARARARSGG